MLHTILVYIWDLINPQHKYIYVYIYLFIAFMTLQFQRFPLIPSLNLNFLKKQGRYYNNNYKKCGLDGTHLICILSYMQFNLGHFPVCSSKITFLQFTVYIQSTLAQRTGIGSLIIKTLILIHMNRPKFKIKGVHVPPRPLKRSSERTTIFWRKPLNYCPRTHMIPGTQLFFRKKDPPPSPTMFTLLNIIGTLGIQFFEEMDLFEILHIERYIHTISGHWAYNIIWSYCNILHVIRLVVKLDNTL